jgi:hypothetical protein
VGVVGLILAAVAIDRGVTGSGPLAILGGVLFVAVAIGAGSVAVVGIAQRRAFKRSGG